MVDFIIFKLIEIQIDLYLKWPKPGIFPALGQSRARISENQQPSFSKVPVPTIIVPIDKLFESILVLAMIFLYSFPSFSINLPNEALVAVT